jgi:hypothetical protein
MSEHVTTTGSGPHFSDAEWEALQKEDLHAGKMVIGLMTSIFSIGVLMYIGVMVSVGLWPHF